MSGEKKYSEEDERQPVFFRDESIGAPGVSAPLPADSVAQDTNASTRLQPGSIIADWYKVITFIGSGGMSNVYKCEDLALNRIIAVKTLHAGAGGDSTRRFQTEGKVIARLEHPNIVRLYGLVLTKESVPLLLMEYVPGITLAKLLENKKALPVQRALKIAGQILEGLKAAEKEGVIHRDLKPSNIMIVNPGSLDESVKILDFGIAKIQGESHLNATRTGEVFGTPKYMSPEQALGKKVDGHTDQYSFACVLFEMLTGVPPFSADNSLALMMAHVQSPKPSLLKTATQAVPGHLEIVMAKMLQKNPADRYSSMADVGKAMFDAKTTISLRTKIICLGAALVAVVATGIAIGAGPQAPNRVAVISGSHELHPTSEMSKSSDIVKAPPPLSGKEAHLDQSKDERLSEGDREINSKLFESESVRELDLHEEDTTDRGLRVVARFSNLEVLNLRKCHRISSEGVAYLKQLPLTELDLQDTNVDRNVGTTLSQMSSLQKLELTGTAVDDQVCQQISHLPRLRDLSLRNDNIDGKALSYLKNIRTLQILNLSGCPNIGYALPELSSLKLKGLIMKSVIFTADQFARSVLRMNSLEHLNLNSTSVDKQQLNKLLSLPRLNQVEVKGCPNLTLADLRSFKASLPGCQLESDWGKNLAVPYQARVAATTGPNLLINGDFENDGVLESFRDVIANQKGISHWQVNAGSIGLTGRIFPAAHGKSSIELNGENAGVLSQAFKTVPGRQYLVQFQASSNPQSTHFDDMQFNVTAGAKSMRVKLPLVSPGKEHMRWGPYSMEFTAKSKSTILKFASETEGACGPMIDDISVKQISSEPGSSEPSNPER